MIPEIPRGIMVWTMYLLEFDKNWLRVSVEIIRFVRKENHFPDQ